MTAETRNSKLENGNSPVEDSQSAIGNRQSAITLPLLLEVGCEEIPARFLDQAQKDLGERVKVILEESRLISNIPVEAVHARPGSSSADSAWDSSRERAGEPPLPNEFSAPSRGKVTLEEVRLIWKSKESAIRKLLVQNDYLDLSGGGSTSSSGKPGEGGGGAANRIPNLAAMFDLATYEKHVASRLEPQVTGPDSRLLTFSTPRRLIVYVPQILERQPDKTEEVMGPPVKVAVDAAGKYTRAAESFAQKNSASGQDFIRITTPKGEYLALKKTTPGRPVLEVLSEVLPGAITGMSFPKSMHWDGSGVRWVRPIRWVLALLGEGKDTKVVPFTIAGVESGSRTFGHRMFGGGPIFVAGFDDYAKKLRAQQVEFIPEKRRWLVLTGVNRSLSTAFSAFVRGVARPLSPISAPETDPDKRLELARAKIKDLPTDFDNLRVIEDMDLEDWIVSSTEWPSPLLGTFDGRFLKLPREILITVMRDHQKYFAVEDERGQLQPFFVTVLNVPSSEVIGDPKGKIRAGHERVLTARFSDAEFFWNADQKIPLRDRVPMLERVTYQAKLGSYGDKVRRMEVIAKEICRSLEEQGKMTATEAADALGAVQLCKCDLTTQMVQEFTELQGVVGGLYARAQGEPQAVADAIYDHYLPQGAEDKCPRSLVGAVVSLADKIYNVAAGFAVGLEPTGSSDPFGLRRAGNGIVRLLAESLRDLDLVDLNNQVHAALGFGPPSLALSQFFQERVEHYLEISGQLRYDTVKAVAYAGKEGWRLPYRALRRGKALEEVRESEAFISLALAAKRTRNILTKSAATANFDANAGIDVGLLAPGPERELYEASERMRQCIEELDRRHEYKEAFQSLAEMRPFVDRFFDSVLVMDDNPQVRANRLALLSNVSALIFSRLANLAEIESNTLTFVGASTGSKTVTSDE